MTQIKTDRRSSSSTYSPKERSQPQRFRGHTLTILGALAESGGLTTRELADKTGLPVNTVYDYCRRGYLRGILEKKERWGWEITAYGGFVRHINNYVTTTTTTTPTLQLHYTDTTPTLNRHKAGRQLDLTAFFSDTDLDEAARAVVAALAMHYERTGQKFRIFQDIYDMADEIGIPFVDLKPALAHLKEEGFLYIRRELLGLKLGLKARLVEMLQHA